MSRMRNRLNNHSKNTVDLNYLATAQNYGAEVFSQHVVRYIEPTAEGYIVHFTNLRWHYKGSLIARRVILSAGSLGSTELLLRCKYGYQRYKFKTGPTLPGLSDKPGHYFSSNGDFGGIATYTDQVRTGETLIDPETGPVVEVLSGLAAGEKYARDPVAAGIATASR